MGADGAGLVSLRKPGLFEVSAGVKVWSRAWALTQFECRRKDQRMASFLSVGLLWEAGLITQQHWRAALPIATGLLQPDYRTRCDNRLDDARIDLACHDRHRLALLEITPLPADDRIAGDCDSPQEEVPVENHKQQNSPEYFC